MVVSRNRRCARQAMVVVRSPEEDGRRGREDGWQDESRRVRMRPTAGEAHHFLVLTPREARARRAAQALQGAATATATATTTATETAARTGAPQTTTALATTDMRRLLLAHAQRARHVLSRRDLMDNLSRVRRREMLVEIQRLNKAIHALQEQIEATTRNVEDMNHLAFQLQQLTRQFLPERDAQAIASSAPSRNEDGTLPDERG